MSGEPPWESLSHFNGCHKSQQEFKKQVLIQMLCNAGQNAVVAIFYGNINFSNYFFSETQVEQRIVFSFGHFCHFHIHFIVLNLKMYGKVKQDQHVIFSTKRYIYIFFNLILLFFCRMSFDLIPNAMQQPAVLNRYDNNMAWKKKKVNRGLPSCL